MIAVEHRSSSLAINSADRAVSNLSFLLLGMVVCALVYLSAKLLGNAYFFFAGYLLLQYVALATAWNILGGYVGYINFGTAAFFAVGAYSTAALYKTFSLSSLRELDLFIVILPASSLPFFILPLCILIGAILAGLIGLGTGYLTLRIRGIYFSIATLAMTIVLHTLVVNSTYLDGARGLYVIRPRSVAIFGEFIHFLFFLMLVVALLAVAISRMIARSQLGWGFKAIQSDELAAEVCGVPTLRSKVLATVISGALMGAVGALFPFFVTHIEPNGVFSLNIAILTMAMALIGGLNSWVGPVLGALLLGSFDIYLRSNTLFKSEFGLLAVGLLMIGFVVVAPNGIAGLLRSLVSRNHVR